MLRNAIPVGGATISVNIPKQIVNDLNIQKGDALEFRQIENGFIVTPVQQTQKKESEDSEQINLPL
ncbi:AbrB/MazE/SpoVT family DNA-binding domain-containing protein, partial [Listeria booriae]|uniref:AbrB/MazE/SpoVT family DNA-binding domain-containing protein n=1 Tax=Listeria booriae TaxID=1552123 RepID=UPI001628E5C0